MINSNLRRVSPLCELARRYIEQDAAGAPIHIAATNYVPYGTTYWEKPYRDYAVTGGLFLQKATHDLDYLSYLMDKPIVRIAAMATHGHVFGGKEGQIVLLAMRRTRNLSRKPSKSHPQFHHWRPSMRIRQRLRQAGRRHTQRRLLQRSARIRLRRIGRLHPGLLHPTRLRRARDDEKRLYGHASASTGTPTNCTASATTPRTVQWKRPWAMPAT